MRTALVGSSGYLAEFILKRFQNESVVDSIVKLDRNPAADVYLDLQEAQMFDYSLLNGVDYVVFTAAISGPDKCAEDYEFCWAINVTGTIYFIKEALKRGCKVLFFSSDAVFGDIPGTIYTEKSDTQPCTPYGRMKKAVEDEFKDNPQFKAIRLSYVVSAKDKFVTYCLNCMKNDEQAVVYHPFYRNAIVVSDVVDIVVYFLKHWDEYEPTFLNVAGKELISRVRIADELNRHFDDTLRYTVSLPGGDFFNNRPRITQMQSLYIFKFSIISDYSFSEKLAKELEVINI